MRQQARCRLSMMLSCASLCMSNVERVGWAFATHGGFPPTPASWGYSGVVRDWTVAYFMGNATGPNNPTEVAAQSRFGIAGVGWQNNNKGSNFSHEERFEAAAAKQIKTSRPAAKVMVTRDTQVVTSFWDSARSAMTTHPEFFLRDPRSGLPVSRAWVSPAGNTPKFWLNFSNAHAAAWWEEAFYGEAIARYDGVYTDCSCEDPPGIDRATLLAVKAAGQISVDRVLLRAAAAGKWVSSWSHDGEVRKPSCAADVRSLLARGQAYATVQHQFNQADHEQSLPTAVAAFLLTRGQYATLMWAVAGIYESATVYVWDAPLLERDWGMPRGDAVEQRTGVFRREFEGGIVVLDCNSFAAAFSPAESDSVVA